MFTHRSHFNACEGTPEFSPKTVYNKSSGPSSLNTETKIKRHTFRSCSKTDKTGSDLPHQKTLKQLRSKSKCGLDLPMVCFVHGGVFSVGACGWRATGLCPYLSVSCGQTCLSRLCPSLSARLHSRPRKQTKPKPRAQRALQRWLRRSSCQSSTSSWNLGQDGVEKCKSMSNSCI